MTEHEKFVASLILPLALYPQWGVWVVQKDEQPIVIVKDTYGQEMFELCDIPEWVIDNESLNKFIDECHPAKWDGDADSSWYEDWFNESGWLTRDIPEQCVLECSAPGQNDDAVNFWVNELGFYIPQPLIQKAKEYLAEFGAWDDAELSQWAEKEPTEHELAKHVLWIFCGDLREGQDCLYLGH